MSTGWYCGSEFRSAVGLARVTDLRLAPCRFASRFRCLLLAIRSPRSEWHAACAPHRYCPALCNLENAYDTADSLAGSRVAKQKEPELLREYHSPYPQKVY